MKKALVVLLFCIALVTCFTMLASAEVNQYEIPKADAPTIDGTIDDGEWENALTVEMTKDDASLFLATGAENGLGAFESATFKFVWNEDGVYFSADVADSTAPMTPPASDTGSYNSGDGIQFNIYTSPEGKDQTPGTLFFSYNPKTDSGKACVGEHFTYGDGTVGGNVDSAKIAAGFDGNAYVIEGLIPAEAFAKVSPALTVESGAQFYMNSVVMEMDEAGKQVLIVDNEWFDATKANVYTLTDIEDTTAESEDDVIAAPDDVSEDIAAGDDSEVLDVIAAPETKAADTEKSETEGDSNNTILFIAIAAAVVVVVIVVVVVVKKKGGNKQQ